ncbi:aminotransferase class I/II-fold pyridoxal phosphate-dependent enzyme [uncultured Sunxiuqinia sp.]|uniref:DegT/DnrJ/EryC1/StrS family aminotransferase n=1 Tax=uncultured Sunxiuqinia sp. TaxID=1573825 RepID=UPI002625C78F|nr:aminotransferase class I/II-fold pyridoxal phosphate-dependent enzyme [uncultured Sunxiuqinia sp.]
MKERIWLSLARMGGHEQAFVQEAFDTNWVVPLGPNVDGFEKDLESFLGEDRQVVALSSGTAALHLGLLLLGVEAGDEVICQSFTFAASANPISYLGAKPVFVDSEADTWNMDPALLEAAICDRKAKTGKYPKAIIPVHLYGMPTQMEEIMEVASRYNIPVLEDAAEALGSTLNGQACGTLGDLGVLSFNGNKMITTSGGGALICRTKAQAEKAKFYATQARDQAAHYEHSQIGYNYRMSNICAGVGRGQMFILKDNIARRQAIHKQYQQWLTGIPGLQVMDRPSEAFDSNFWLSCLTIDPEQAGFSREDLRLVLDAQQIESRPLWKPMHLQPVFAGAPVYERGVSEQLFELGLCLPSGPVLTDADVERVVKTILEFCAVHQGV